MIFRCNILTCTVFHYPTKCRCKHLSHSCKPLCTLQYMPNDVLHNPGVFTHEFLLFMRLTCTRNKDISECYTTNYHLANAFPWIIVNFVVVLAECASQTSSKFQKSGLPLLTNTWRLLNRNYGMGFMSWKQHQSICSSLRQITYNEFPASQKPG